MAGIGVDFVGKVGCASHSTAKGERDAVLEELEAKRANYEAHLKENTSCFDEFDRGLIEGKECMCIIFREWIKELRQKKEEPQSQQIQKEVSVAFFYQESIPYPKGEYKFRMKIIDEMGERATPERQSYAEAFTDLFNIGIKEHRFFRECGDKQNIRSARIVMKDIAKLRQQQTKEQP